MSRRASLGMASPPSFLSKLARRINPPLLTTPKDSERLRQGLNKSFQKQLDLEHSITSVKSPGRPIDAHVNAIVTSPFFASLAGTSRNTSTTRPNEEFRREVSAGNATLAIAKDCLQRSTSVVLLNEEKLPFAEQAALVQSILRWLWSSGMEESMEFIHDMEFVKLLMSKMSPEDQLLHSKKWFNRLSSIVIVEGDKLTSSTEAWMGALVALFRYSVYKGRLNRSAPVEAISKDFLGDINKISKELPESFKSAIVRGTMLPLVRVMLRGSNRSELGLETHKALTTVAKEYFHKNLWMVAALSMLHPSSPNAKHALSYFHSFTSDGAHRLRANQVDLAAAAVKLLTSQGHTSKAQTLLERLQAAPTQRERGEALKQNDWSTTGDLTWAT